jgi:hypothetical protein
MIEVAARSILIYHNGYCSQRTAAIPPIRTIDEGIDAIEKVLQKEILCVHDVENINRAYEAIDLLERRVETIPDRNSRAVLTLLIQRIERARQNSLDIISIYHLQSFTNPDMKSRFQKRFQQLQQASFDPREIAEYIPCCQSLHSFYSDTVAIIPSFKGGGVLKSSTACESDDKKKEIRVRKIASLRATHPNQYPPFLDKLLENNCYEEFDRWLSVHTTINNRRLELEKHEQLLKMVRERKESLSLLRRDDPQKYPSYFDELLENGYVYLYDHLIEMRGLKVRNEREQEGSVKTFSAISQIVLETRESIIRKVESCIPPHQQNVLFLLGGTGAGKSTTLCYLRGDKMERKGDRFDSSSFNKVIGHEADASCTFLPTTELVNDLVIVDFPGFNDSNGEHISLGMELALKALIQRYHPKVLVLEAITNTGERYSAVAKLGRRLTRLLDNKQDCVLGFTKYINEPHFKEIAHIEERQRREVAVPSEEEKILVEDIGYLSRRKPPTDPELLTLQAKLENLRAEKNQQGTQQLPDTPEKKEHRKALEQTEATMLEEVGLRTFLRFADLENSELLLASLRDLSSKPKVSTNPSPQLEAGCYESLNRIFEHQLLKQINEMGYTSDLDIKSFEERVLNSSLIRTITSRSHPEIGDFLHLPEMDHKVAREFDKEILKGWIRGALQTVFRDVDLELFEAIIENAPSRSVKDIRKPKDALKDKNDLKRSLDALTEYVKGLLGEQKTSGKDKKEVWAKIQERNRVAAQTAVDKEWKVPTLITVLLGLPLGIPLGIRGHLKKRSAADKLQQLTDDEINDACQSVDEMLHALTTLKGIERLINQQDLINEIFASLQLDVGSEKALKASIEKKLLEIKKAYDDNYWETRVETLKNRFFYRLKPSSAATNYLALVSLLLDDTITCVQSTKSLVPFIKEMGLLPSAQNALLTGDKNILLKGKMNATVFIIEINRRAQESIAHVDEKLSTDKDLLERIDQFKIEIDIRRPIFRAMLADIIMRLFA